MIVLMLQTDTMSLIIWRKACVAEWRFSLVCRLYSTEDMVGFKSLPVAGTCPVQPATPPGIADCTGISLYKESS